MTINLNTQPMLLDTKPQEDGIVIQDHNTKEFYTGISWTAGWSHQLRKAKIYKSEKYAKQVIDKHTDRRTKMRRIRIAILD